MLSKHFGCVRLVYNLAVETKSWVCTSRKINLTRYDLQVQLKELKKDHPWLKEVNSQSLQVALLHLDRAYSNFFKGRAEFPKLKRRGNRWSFHQPQNVRIEKSRLSIPKFGSGIEMVVHRPIKGIIKSATVSKTPTGKYDVSILAETKEKTPSKRPVKRDTAVGIDIGIKTFAVLSDGTEFDNPEHLKQSLERL